jgi:tetratricopeptide (TPR) repeat protein
MQLNYFMPTETVVESVSGDASTAVLAPAATTPAQVSLGYGSYSYCDPCHMMHQGRWRDAISTFEYLLIDQTASNRPQLLSDYAWGLAHVGKVDKALENVELALKDAKSGTDLWDDAHGTRGFILMKKEQYNEALRDLEIAVAGRPWDRDALFNYGMVLQQLGKKKEGKDAVVKALALGYRELPPD